MNAPTALESRIVRIMTETEFVDKTFISMMTTNLMVDINLILERWEREGYAVNTDFGWSLTR